MVRFSSPASRRYGRGSFPTRGITLTDVLVCMGSDSDAPIMKQAVEVLAELGLEADLRILSAHRTPQRMMSAALEAESRGYRSSSPARAGRRICRARWPR